MGVKLSIKTKISLLQDCQGSAGLELLYDVRELDPPEQGAEISTKIRISLQTKYHIS